MQGGLSFAPHAGASPLVMARLINATVWALARERKNPEGNSSGCFAALRGNESARVAGVNRFASFDARQRIAAEEMGMKLVGAGT